MTKSYLTYFSFLSLTILSLLYCGKADAQGDYSQVTALPGDTQFIRGNRVIVSSLGSVTSSRYIDLCDAPPILRRSGVSWSGDPGSHTYEFESPVTTFQLYIIHVNNLVVNETVSFYINGTHYPLTTANLDTLTCTTPLQKSRPLDLTNNGDVTLNRPIPAGDWSANGIVNIYFKEGISSLMVRTNGWGGGAPYSIGFKGFPLTTHNNGDSICIGDTLRLYAMPDVPTVSSYYWRGPNNFTSTEQNPTIPNIDQIGEGQYIVTVTTPHDIVSDTTVVALGHPTSFTLKKNLPCGQKVFTYNGVDYEKAGIYTQTLTNARGCDSVVTLELTFKSIVHPIVNIDTFTLGTSQSYQTYQWLLNGSIIQGATDSVYTVTQNGAYQVIVTNELGCKDTSDIYQITNYTGIEDIHSVAHQIHIYPNPAKDIVHIDAPVPVQVTLSGIDGRILKQVTNTSVVPLAGLASGMYLIQIRDQNNRLIKTEKLILQ